MSRYQQSSDDDLLDLEDNYRRLGLDVPPLLLSELEARGWRQMPNQIIDEDFE